MTNSKYEDRQHQFEMVLHLSQGEVAQVAEERSENESQKDKEEEVGHQVEPFFKCPNSPNQQKNVYCLPREGKGVYGTERSKGAGNVVEDVDHAGANAEEGSEGEDRQVLGNQEKFLQEGLARQQVLRSSH